MKQNSLFQSDCERYRRVYFDQPAVLGHKRSQNPFTHLQSKHLKHWPLEQSPPNYVFMASLPLCSFDGTQQSSFPLQPNRKQIYNQRQQIRNVRVLSIYSDGDDCYQWSQHEKHFPKHLAEGESFPCEICRNGLTCHKLNFFAIGKLLKHLRLMVFLHPLPTFDVFQHFLDALKFGFLGWDAGRLGFWREFVFLEEDIGWLLGVPVGAVVLSSFQIESDEFCGDEKLLKDGSLLSKLVGDQEFSHELKSSEVLEVQALLETALYVVVQQISVHIIMMSPHNSNITTLYSSTG